MFYLLPSIYLPTQVDTVDSTAASLTCEKCTWGEEEEEEEHLRDRDSGKRQPPDFARFDK